MAYEIECMLLRLLLKKLRLTYAIMHSLAYENLNYALASDNRTLIAWQNHAVVSFCRVHLIRATDGELIPSDHVHDLDADADEHVADAAKRFKVSISLVTRVGLRGCYEP